MNDLPIKRGGTASLVDVLDRILDKGLVVAGDIRISLADVELITIRIRLILCSVDKAEAIGLDWWRSDPFFSSAARALSDVDAKPLPSTSPGEHQALAARLDELDRKIAALLDRGGGPPAGSS